MKDKREILLSHIIQITQKLGKVGDVDILREYLKVLFKKLGISHTINISGEIISFRISHSSSVHIDLRNLTICIPKRCVIDLRTRSKSTDEIVERLYINILRNEYDANVWL